MLLFILAVFAILLFVIPAVSAINMGFYVALHRFRNFNL